MTGLDYFTFIVLGVLIGAGIWIAILLGGLPGRLAAERGHPQADAIRLAGWFGLLTLGVLWPFALIWAFTKPRAAAELVALRESIEGLSARVEVLEAEAGSGSPTGEAKS
jgi:hypothetical protein